MHPVSIIPCTVGASPGPHKVVLGSCFLNQRYLVSRQGTPFDAQLSGRHLLLLLPFIAVPLVLVQQAFGVADYGAMRAWKFG